MIKVTIVDDHELVRTGIIRILKDEPDLEVVAEASSGEEAIQLVKQYRPDVVLMDVNMPGIGGFEATRKLIQMYPDLKVIVVTIHVDDPFPSRMLQAGAMGYLTKGCGVEEIINAIREVNTGRRYISADVAQHLALKLMPGGEESPFDSLSPRELQVMLMLTQGTKVQEISDKLCLSPKTVSTYRHRLYDKLGVSSDVALTRLAMRYGMVDDAYEPVAAPA
ncbi:MAG: UvrY/SirA/GacA family response regulator transcription factor [Gammaproteobacteria bacterium]|jgi:two-component system invasion response regulator UvrY